MKKENLALVTELRRELHQHPEPSNEEVWTKERLIEFLKTHTSLEIEDRGKWFYAVYRAGEGKRNIAFRADFDAIRLHEKNDFPHVSQNPGVSHKCGHDGHSASLAGLALEIDQLGAEQNVFFYSNMPRKRATGLLRRPCLSKKMTFMKYLPIII